MNIEEYIFNLNPKTVIWFVTWVGAICAHMLTLHSPDFNGITPFLQKIFPNKSETFYHRVDFIVLPLMGAFLAIVLLEPANVRTSLFAGLSWSGTLIALLKDKTHKVK